MSEDPGGRRRLSDSRFHWAVVGGLIALAMILGTISELLK